jgi:hypothetical protein
VPAATKPCHSPAWLDRRPSTTYQRGGQSLLPHTMLDPVHFSTLRLYIGGCQIGLSVAAFIVLWVRLRSVLDLCGHRRTVENHLEAEHSPRPSNRSVLNTVQTRPDFPAMLKSTDL